MPSAGAAIAAVKSIAAARTSAPAGSSSNGCSPIADSSDSSFATSSFATSSVATSSAVDNTRTCAVCVARASGTRIPKRKCTCASGMTAGRITLVATSVRHNERAERDSLSIMYPAESFHDEMNDAEFEEMQEFALKLQEMIKAGDVDGVRLLGKRGCKLVTDESTDEMYWADCWREALSCACECGQLDVLAYLFDECNASLIALCPHGDPLDPEYEALGHVSQCQIQLRRFSSLRSQVRQRLSACYSNVALASTQLRMMDRHRSSQHATKASWRWRSCCTEMGQTSPKLIRMERFLSMLLHAEATFTSYNFSRKSESTWKTVALSTLVRSGIRCSTTRHLQ